MCMSIAAVAAKPRSLPADAGVSVRRHMLDISVRRQVQYEDNKSSSERCWESRWRAASSDREAVSVACRAKFVFVTATRSNLSFQLTPALPCAQRARRLTWRVARLIPGPGAKHVSRCAVTYVAGVRTHAAQRRCGRLHVGVTRETPRLHSGRGVRLGILFCGCVCLFFVCYSFVCRSLSSAY